MRTDDIDIHNIRADQSLILHDMLYIDYSSRDIHVDIARTKDLVYNTHTAQARKHNSQKFNDNYAHTNTTYHTTRFSDYVDNDVSFLLKKLYVCASKRYIWTCPQHDKALKKYIMH